MIDTLSVVAASPMPTRVCVWVAVGLGVILVVCLLVSWALAYRDKRNYSGRRRGTRRDDARRN